MILSGVMKATCTHKCLQAPSQQFDSRVGVFVWPLWEVFGDTCWCACDACCYNFWMDGLGVYLWCMFDVVWHEEWCEREQDDIADTILVFRSTRLWWTSTDNTNQIFVYFRPPVIWTHLWLVGWFVHPRCLHFASIPIVPRTPLALIGFRICVNKWDPRTSWKVICHCSALHELKA